MLSEAVQLNEEPQVSNADLSSVHELIWWRFAKANEGESWNIVTGSGCMLEIITNFRVWLGLCSWSCGATYSAISVVLSSVTQLSKQRNTHYPSSYEAYDSLDFCESWREHFAVSVLVRMYSQTFVEKFIKQTVHTVFSTRNNIHITSISQNKSPNNAKLERLCVDKYVWSGNWDDRWKPRILSSYIPALWYFIISWVITRPTISKRFIIAS